jgi:hypothetical protein
MALGITFSAGQKLFASDLQDMVDQIDSLTDPNWTSYTTTWAASGTAPAIGNGTLAARYRRSASSDLVIAEVRMAMGSTTTYGTGFYSWTLPFTAASNANLFTSGKANLYDSSALTRFGASAKLDSVTTVILNAHNGTIGQTIPFTWANGDEIRWTVQYEAA